MKSITLLLAAGISAVAFTAAAQAADLVIDEAPAFIPGVVETTGNFDGLFVGVFGGYAIADLEFDLGGLPGFVPDIDPQGWLLGVDAGANFTLGSNMVVGVVGDIAWANITDEFDFGGLGGGFSSTIDWQGSLRARAGIDAGGFMPYLTAGLAFAHNTVEVTTPAIPGPATTTTDDQTHIGWTVGAGVEMAVADNISVDALYRYSDYGDATYAAGLAGPGTGDLGITSHQLSLGLHFGF